LREIVRSVNYIRKTQIIVTGPSFNETINLQHYSVLIYVQLLYMMLPLPLSTVDDFLVMHIPSCTVAMCAEVNSCLH